MTHSMPDTSSGPCEDASPATGAPLPRRLLISGIGLAAAAAIGLLIGSGRDDAPAAQPQPGTPALTVTAAAPQRVDWPVTLAASGAIAPWQEAIIGAQIGGYRLVDVRVNVGDRVRRGEVLARLDPALLQAEEAQLVASYEQAEANRLRAIGMRGSGAISDQDVLQFVTQARTAAATLAGKRLELRYTHVVAPDDGTISARAATLGAVVPAGQELFRLIRRDRLEWRGELTAAQLSQVGIGQAIALQLPDGSGASATVRQTAPSLDSQSRLAIVYADIRSGSRARAGMYAEGSIELGRSPALVVPAESVIIRDGRSHVLVLADGSATPRVSLRDVTVGRRQGREVEIVRGLAANERIVVQGAGFLKDRDIVRVAAPARPAGAARP
ncbi:MAG: efflux RND transporter periplasmic adaptor subunit [Sphingomonas sp.]|uniref:efflux RND transporter periplasmic adaptor subunit n=1 Tax=Sphingomonas sp. TaxID=28214 RepID=UPI0022735102|nr:efflux RND transporter periplasmic adaptor subunit [Sphingomonas sp.]MCX8475364.1 efflux RND transporter periplasmic adaptor subunit [Sphingomonas sp.]